MAELLPFPPTIATVDIGELSSSISLEVSEGDDSSLLLSAKRDPFQYTLSPSTGAPGTLFIRNRRTNELTAVPSCAFMRVHREFIYKEEDATGEESYSDKYQSLISNYGSKQAKRFQKLKNANK